MRPSHPSRVWSARRHGLPRLFGVMLALLASGCSLETAIEGEPIGGLEQEVIYGVDDRLDYHAVTDPMLRELTAKSIAAMVDAANVDATDPNNVRLIGEPLQQAYGLCAGERFSSQPTAASCSGTLVDHDLVITAGHCIDSSDCAEKRWVFGYYEESPGTLHTITSADVYRCTRVVAHRYVDAGSLSADYAVVQLDRSVAAEHRPVRVSRSRTTLGARITMIGFGVGLPAKVDTGGTVTRDNQFQGGFEATVDAFGGNSGSGVFDPTGQMVGILNAGATDFVMRGSCSVANVLSQFPGTEGAETLTHVDLAVTALCATGHRSSLCGTAPACGDGVCDPSESSTCLSDCGAPPVCGDGMCGTGEATACPRDCVVCGNAICEDGETTTCPADCAPSAQCGNLICEGSETTTCPTDCAPSAQCGNLICEGSETISCPTDCGSASTVPPAGWLCPPSQYARGDGCNCQCGAPDPDCADPRAPVHGCAPGLVCSASAVCVAATPSMCDDQDLTASVAPCASGSTVLVGQCSAGGAGGQSAAAACLLLWLARRPRRRA